MDNLKIKLEFRNKKPISDQVHEEMLRLIEQGELHPGDQLPTVRRLAAQLRVNFNTIARAYRVLDQEGWISTQQGRGTYVLDPKETAAQDQPLSQREQTEQLITQLLARAHQIDIPAEALLEELFKQVQAAKPQKNPLRKVRVEQKKRAPLPSWYRQWRRSERRIDQIALRFKRPSVKKP